VGLAAAFGVGGPAWATDVRIVVEAQGFESSFITVGAGCEVGYRVTAELADATNQGLAAIVFDLEYSGGALLPAQAPAELPMAAFVPPNGLANPDGYGGTPQGGRLVQVGGAQNVSLHGRWSCEIDDDCPDLSTCNGGTCTAIQGLPLAEVVPDVAGPGSPVVVATGTLIVPTEPGTYELVVANVHAAVHEQGAKGRQYWPTEAAGLDAAIGLSIMVESGASCSPGPGACCLGDGTCTLLVPADCVNLFEGVTLGSDSVCEGDADGDGIDGACGDACPDDPDKTEPGLCGCGVEDSNVDTDGDTVPDCIDQCPGADDLVDLNADGVPDCLQSAAIPTVSHLGLLIFALLLVATAALVLGRRWQ